MLYVHKRSVKPVPAWGAMRLGGANNIAPQASKYLVLMGAEAILRNGVWHYLLEFDARNSLEMSTLAHAVLGLPAATGYRDCMNWKSWLGEDWELIDEHRRWELLHAQRPEHSADAVITDLREISRPQGKPLAPEFAGYDFRPSRVLA
jgi:hypothetical protein